MNGMLRHDGYYVFYFVQFKDARGRWCTASYDSLFAGRVPAAIRVFGTVGGTHAEPFRSFSASGDCWQQIGVHATFDYNRAVEMCALLAEYNTDTDFRVVRATVEQDVTPVEEMELWGT